MRDRDDDPWWRYGVCAQIGSEFFFPPVGDNAHDAKRACRMCEVRLKCLADSITTDIECGIFGGLGRDERRRLIREVEHGRSPVVVAAEAIAQEAS